MIRIGIVGSDNSHADAFSQMLNIADSQTGEFAYPDVRVTAIFGLDEKRTAEVALDGKIEHIVKDPSEMIGMVDAVMVVFRHGGLHAKYALPFIEAGIPTWIDKPFCIDEDEVRQLIAASKKHHTLITGGSTCKYTYDVQMARETVTGNGRIGKFRTGVINFPAELDSEYGGFYFYAGHLSEMALETFGWDMKRVTAREKNGVVTAIAEYDDYQITMNFIPENNFYYVILYGDNGVVTREIDLAICYKLAFEKFYQMLKTGKMPVSYGNIFKPVALLNAIEKSYKTNETVEIHDLYE